MKTKVFEPHWKILFSPIKSKKLIGHRRVNIRIKFFFFLHKRSLGQGNIFRSVCHSVHKGQRWACLRGQLPQERGQYQGVRGEGPRGEVRIQEGSASKRFVYRGVCIQGCLHPGEGVCNQGGLPMGGFASPRGGSASARSAFRRVGQNPPNQKSGRHAPYWNAFFF